MKIFGILAAAVLASGETCLKPGKNAVWLQKKELSLHVMAMAPSAWVGFGIPKSVNSTGMALGNFVACADGEVYDLIKGEDENGPPGITGTNGFIRGTQHCGTKDNMTVLQFERLLKPVGYHPIDPTKPFRILWAFGELSEDGDNATIQYHGNSSRGSLLVDLSKKGNCDAVTLAAFQKIYTPAKAKGERGKKKAKGKRKVKRAKTAAVKGKAESMEDSSKIRPVECSADQIRCTPAHQAQGANCIVGMCFALPACLDGQIRCTAAHQGQGKNCVVGMCFQDQVTGSVTSRPPRAVTRECGPREVRCTPAVQARGITCELEKCVSDPDARTGPCPPGQVLCTPTLQATVTCTLDECVDFRLTTDTRPPSPKP